MFGFGDNSRGQIQSIHNGSIWAARAYRKPTRLTCLEHLFPALGDSRFAPAARGDSMTIYADARQSALRIGSQDHDTGRLYGWGTRNMIDAVSKGAQV